MYAPRGLMSANWALVPSQFCPPDRVEEVRLRVIDQHRLTDVTSNDGPLRAAG